MKDLNDDIVRTIVHYTRVVGQFSITGLSLYLNCKFDSEDSSAHIEYLKSKKYINKVPELDADTYTTSLTCFFKATYSPLSLEYVPTISTNPGDEHLSNVVATAYDTECEIDLDLLRNIEDGLIDKSNYGKRLISDFPDRLKSNGDTSVIHSLRRAAMNSLYHKSYEVLPSTSGLPDPNVDEIPRIHGGISPLHICNIIDPQVNVDITLDPDDTDSSDSDLVRPQDESGIILLEQVWISQFSRHMRPSDECVHLEHIDENNPSSAAISRNNIRVKDKEKLADYSSLDRMRILFSARTIVEQLSIGLYEYIDNLLLISNITTDRLNGEVVYVDTNGKFYNSLNGYIVSVNNGYAPSPNSMGMSDSPLIIPLLKLPNIGMWTWRSRIANNPWVETNECYMTYRTHTKVEAIAYIRNNIWLGLDEGEYGMPLSKEELSIKLKSQK